MACWRRAASRLFHAGCATIAWIFAAATASAQAPSDGDMAAARALGTEGVALADRGECESAVEKLERASKIYAAPTLLVPLGECHIKLGRLVVGAEILQRVSREELAANAPRPFVLAQQRARATLEKTTPRIGKLKIEVVAPAGASFTVTDNDTPVRDVLVGSDRPADPGHHVVVASGRGLTTAKQEVDLAEGASKTLKLELAVDPTAPPPTPTEEPKPDEARDERADEGTASSEDSSVLLPIGLVALGVGGAGLITWGVTGALGLSTASDLDDTCSEGTCPPSSQGQIDELGTLGVVSTIGLVVGGVGVGLGVTLLVVDATSGEDTGGRAASPRVAVRARPGGAVLEGRF